MSQNVMFLTNAEGKQFALINLSQFCYIDGVEETEEHPDGSKTRVCFHGYAHTVDMPYRQIAEAIAKQIKDGYEFSAKWEAARRDAATEASGNMMREVLRDYNDGHH